MDYTFLSQSDESLIEYSELPTENGIAVVVRSTGYDVEDDEVLELAIVDLEGNELFSKLVKPQNVETWDPTGAADGISPADVAESPELYQFEEEISALFEKRSVVVAAHLSFVESMIESSWVTLPKFTGFDIIAEFLESHSSADAPNEPATAASLQGIANYYGIDTSDASLVGSARQLAASYQAFVKEHADKRQAKGTDYWERYEQRKAEEAALANAMSPADVQRERFLNRMNGLLWITGGIIFVSLVIQTYQSDGNMVFMLLFGLVAGFCFARGIQNLRK